ncbi:hypothetical protein G9A89_013030 [Geosiphon pyriformis]|nr:hypothetical protein G9A89_013030 [Geosiphon pyriformis]
MAFQHSSPTVSVHSEYSGSECDPNDERWDDWEEEEAQTNLKCLFCSDLFSTPNNAFKHCKEEHGFDFRGIKANFNLDFYQCIRLLNYIRYQGFHNPQLVTTPYIISGTETFLNDDEYLKPVIDDDPLLYAFDSEEPEEDFKNTGSIYKEKFSPTTPLEQELLERLHISEERLFNSEVHCERIETQFTEYRGMVKKVFLKESFDTSSEHSSINKTPSVIEDHGNYYYNSYAKTGIHAEMLKDRVRTESYRDFIYENKGIFKGKVVLDVGCGTGILSLFAARAGAARVLSVDESAIIERAREIVRANQLENIITLIPGKIEEVTLPVPKVDIIISEWMGYFLLFEAMLDSILFARDRWLAPGGLLAPSHCQIMLTGIEEEDMVNDLLDFWNDVYGFDMSPMRSQVQSAAHIEAVEAKAIVTNIISIKEISLDTIKKSELDFNVPFTLTADRSANIHALLGYFDTWFTRDHEISSFQNVEQKVEGITSFSTGPKSETTHWRQTVFLLEKGIPVSQGTKITGSFECRKRFDNPRDLDIKIQYQVIDQGNEENRIHEEHMQKFFLR